MTNEAAPLGLVTGSEHPAVRLLHLLAHLDDLPLPDAAARLAAAGLPVFPCRPGEKRPLSTHGLLDATIESDVVTAWWRRWPAANVGLPTGAVSGLVVLDVDQRPNGSGYPTFTSLRQRGLVSGWAGLVRTPSGGMHAYYPADPAQPARSWQAGDHHIDFRGDGGYVIAPPSRVIRTDGVTCAYRVARVATAEPRVLSVMTIRNLLLPSAIPPGGIGPAVAGQRTGADPDRLAHWVAARAEGERNRGLFWAACRLAELGTSDTEISNLLGPAAERAGLPPQEISSTIRSALRTAGDRRGPAPPPRRSSPSVRRRDLDRW